MKKLEMCPWKNTELWLENSSPMNPECGDE
jgi:hypothetical protein